MWNMNTNIPLNRRNLHSSTSDSEEEGEISGTHSTPTSVTTSNDNGPSALTSASSVPSVPLPSPSIHRATTVPLVSSRDREWGNTTGNAIDRPYSTKRERSWGTPGTTTSSSVSSSNPPLEVPSGIPPPLPRIRNAFSGPLNADRPSLAPSPPPQQRRGSVETRTTAAFAAPGGRDVRDWDMRRAVSSSSTGGTGGSQRRAVGELSSVAPNLSSPAARSASYGSLGVEERDRDGRERNVDRDREGVTVRLGERDWGTMSAGGAAASGRERELWGSGSASSGPPRQYRSGSSYAALATERDGQIRDREWDRFAPAVSSARPDRELYPTSQGPPNFTRPQPPSSMHHRGSIGSSSGPPTMEATKDRRDNPVASSQPFNPLSKFGSSQFSGSRIPPKPQPQPYPSSVGAGSSSTAVKSGVAKTPSFGSTNLVSTAPLVSSLPATTGAALGGDASDKPPAPATALSSPTARGATQSAGSKSDEVAATPLTTASLGAEDKIRKAEKAVQKLSQIVDYEPSVAPQDDASLVLPTKDQIVKGLADIEIQIKSKTKCTDRLKDEIEEALKVEEEVKRTEEEAAREQERVRLQEEEKQRQLQFEKEREEKRMETLKQLQQKRVAKERQLVELKAKLQEKLALENSTAESELEVEWRTKIERKERTLRKAKDALSSAKARATKSSEDVRAKQTLFEEKQKSDEAATQASALVSPPHDAADECFDDPEQMTNLVSSIMEENRRRAQQAHLDSLSILSYEPLSDDPVGSDAVPFDVNAENAKDDSRNESILLVPAADVAGAQEDGSDVVAANAEHVEGDEVEELTPVSNAEWTALTRRIMSPAEALYVDPMDSPYWQYHEQRHNIIGHLVMEKVMKKKMMLHRHWEDLAAEYLSWQMLRKSLSGDDSSDEVEENPKRMVPSRPTRNLTIASYRRPRRPPRGGAGGTSGGTSFLGGLGDVARSDYEQELIMKELKEKEAMENRIKHGGCTLPRQITALERELTVTYRVDFAPRRVLDVLGEERDARHINPWTDMEKCIFFDRFLQYPKDFKKIASFLRNKTTTECVAFYYDAKKSMPLKAALREHLLRKKRRADVSWTATVQCALSAGANVSDGDDERPFTFSLPEGDITYNTTQFHPMQQEIFDLSRVDRSEYTIVSGTAKSSAHQFTFMLDDPKLTLSLSTLVPGDENEDASISAKKGRLYSEAVESSLGETSNKMLRTTSAESVHDAKALDAEVGDTGAEEDVGSSSLLNVPRKMPQKWTAEERKVFVENVEKHGKDWPTLVAAVGNKTLQQVKNFYYDTIKKQTGRRHRELQGSRPNADDENAKDSESLSGIEDDYIELPRQQEDEDCIVPSTVDTVDNRAHANAQRIGLQPQLVRENHQPPSLPPGPGLHPYGGADRGGQINHHEFFSSMSNMNPWVAAAQLLQSHNPRMTIRDAWTLEATLRQQHLQQLAYTLGGHNPAAHFPRDMLNHMRAAGYSSPGPFMGASPADTQAALAALSQMSAARNLAAVAQRMASRSGDATIQLPDGSSYGSGGSYPLDADYGNDTSSQ